MKIDVPRLLVLRAIRDSGGILAAADELRVSSSAVSQQLSKLERETGLVLVIRGSASSQLTPAGLRLAERADAIAHELRATDRDIAQLVDTQQRSVVVGGFPSVIQTLVTRATRALRDAEPSIHVRIVETRDEGAHAHAELRARRLDVVLTKRRVSADPAPAAAIAETIIRDDPYRVVIPAAWPVPKSITELLDRPWVSHPQDADDNDVLERLQRQEGKTLRFEHECTEYPVAIALAAAGLAACIVPELAIASTPVHGTHVVPFGDLGHRRIVAQYRNESEQDIAVAALLDQLRNQPA